MDGWMEWMVIIGRRWSKCTFGAKKWAKKWMEICAIKGEGVRRLMANAIKNFHIFSLMENTYFGCDS